MKNKPRAPPEERVFSASSDSSGKKMMLRSEQESAEWMMDEVSVKVIPELRSP